MTSHYDVTATARDQPMQTTELGNLTSIYQLIMLFSGIFLFTITQKQRYEECIYVNVYECSKYIDTLVVFRKNKVKYFGALNLNI